MTRPWHPRGEPTWPNWKKAKPGVTRLRHVRSGYTGTFVKWPAKHPSRRNPGYALVRWDKSGIASRVVAYAFDLEEIK